MNYARVRLLMATVAVSLLSYSAPSGAVGVGVEGSGVCTAVMYPVSFTDDIGGGLPGIQPQDRIVARIAPFEEVGYYLYEPLQPPGSSDYRFTGSSRRIDCFPLPVDCDGTAPAIVLNAPPPYPQVCRYEMTVTPPSPALSILDCQGLIAIKNVDDSPFSPPPVFGPSSAMPDQVAIGYEAYSCAGGVAITGAPFGAFNMSISYIDVEPASALVPDLPGTPSYWVCSFFVSTQDSFDAFQQTKWDAELVPGATFSGTGPPDGPIIWDGTFNGLTAQYGVLGVTVLGRDSLLDFGGLFNRHQWNFAPPSLPGSTYARSDVTHADEFYEAVGPSAVAVTIPNPGHDCFKDQNGGAESAEMTAHAVSQMSWTVAPAIGF